MAPRKQYGAGDRAARYRDLYLPARTPRSSRHICAMLAWAAVHPHLSYWGQHCSVRAQAAPNVWLASLHLGTFRGNQVEILGAQFDAPLSIF
jgi:hypothetical protein